MEEARRGGGGRGGGGRGREGGQVPRLPDCKAATFALTQLLRVQLHRPGPLAGQVFQLLQSMLLRLYHTPCFNPTTCVMSINVGYSSPTIQLPLSPPISLSLSLSLSLSVFLSLSLSLSHSRSPSLTLALPLSLSLSLALSLSRSSLSPSLSLSLSLSLPLSILTFLSFSY